MSRSDPPLCHHAAVGVVIQQKMILISKRPAHKLKGGYWEFPGGKIEENETPEQALVRELQEEVGIQALELQPLIQHYHDYSEHSALLEVFVVTRFVGEPKSLEKQEIRWVPIESLSDYQFLEANQVIIENLSLWIKNTK